MSAEVEIWSIFNRRLIERGVMRTPFGGFAIGSAPLPV